MAEVREDRPTKEKAVGVAVRALQEIEAIAGDSKLTAFGVLLTQLNKTKTPSQRICVLTEFRATLYYAAAEIEGRGTSCQLLHSEMRAEDRAETLEFFLNAGGILVATTAVMIAGVNLSKVTDLILYDIPGSKVALQQVLGRFNRFGRLSELNVYVFTPSNAQEGFVAKYLGLLHDIL
jgi:superfamily II DNA/RNA helicase